MAVLSYTKELPAVVRRHADPKMPRMRARKVQESFQPKTEMEIQAMIRTAYRQYISQAERLAELSDEVTRG